METIKVNMNPNPLDVQTIHASQNDGEARQWGFKLHNNGDVIDSSEITDQMVFKAYKGGTEQLLPENTSTPTTSPFLGDIRYPQGLLTNQEFTYRQSPTEEDGLAKITDIKGNTLNWNQLLQSLAPTVTRSGVTFTKNNDGTWTLNGTATANIDFRFDQTNALISNPRTYYANHKYLLKVNKVNGVRLIIMQQTTWAEPLSTSRNTGAYDMQTLSKTYENMFAYFFVTSGTSFANVVLKPQLFDLTQMGLDITEPSEFTSLFPLSYYSYNQGSLLSFNGNGIKTVGKNLLPKARASSTMNGITWTLNEDGTIHAQGTSTGRSYIRVTIFNENNFMLPKGDYVYTLDPSGSGINDVYSLIGSYKYGSSLYYKNVVYARSDNNFTGLFSVTDEFVDCVYDIAIEVPTSGKTVNCDIKPMIRSASVSDTTYEPYTTQTTNIPVATYFPTGMKSAGTVYDELTPMKAITRIGAVDLGSLEWTYQSSYSRFNAGSVLSNLAKLPSSNFITANIICSRYQPTSSNNTADANYNLTIGLSVQGSIQIRDTNYTDSATLKNSLQGVYLYYELATPTETSFTTASLVTENAEIPLSNNEGVLIGKCTEELSAEPGFHDAKIKLADGDGECYSNKIQLHIERSPQ